MECLTNLHVGTGSANFGIVDLEVEKDPTTGYPVINSTGVKGAIKDYCESRSVENLGRIFGDKGSKERIDTAGDFKFFDAEFLYRPLRADGSVPSVCTTSVSAINSFLSQISAFGCNPFGITKIDEVSFGDRKIACAIKLTSIDGDKPADIDADSEIRKILGIDTFAIAKNLNRYPLPVVARNALDDKGISKNLWYTEFVPKGSAFYLIVLTPDSYSQGDMLNVIPDGAIIQFGGNASVGYGFCKLSLTGKGEL